MCALLRGITNYMYFPQICTSAARRVIKIGSQSVEEVCGVLINNMDYLIATAVTIY